ELRWRARPIRRGMPAAATAAAVRQGASVTSAMSYRLRRTNPMLRSIGPSGGRACPGATAQNGSAAMTDLTWGRSAPTAAVYRLHQRSIAALGNAAASGGASDDANTRSPRLASATIRMRAGASCALRERAGADDVVR